MYYSVTLKITIGELENKTFEFKHISIKIRYQNNEKLHM